MPIHSIESPSRVLRLIYDEGVSNGIKKCKFFAKAIAYAGHVICTSDLELVRDTTEAVKKPEKYTFWTEMAPRLEPLQRF